MKTLSETHLISLATLPLGIRPLTGSSATISNAASSTMSASSNSPSIFSNVVATWHSSVAVGVAAYQEQQRTALLSWPLRHCHFRLRSLFNPRLRHACHASNPGHANATWAGNNGSFINPSSYHHHQPTIQMPTTLVIPYHDSGQAVDEPFNGASIAHIYHRFVCELILFCVFNTTGVALVAVLLAAT